MEEQLVTQRRRLADAERALETKTTKKATEERRSASNKVTWLLGKLKDLRRPPGSGTEARIYPGVFCAVMTMDRDGGYVIVPMRYQCRPAGKPAAYDQRYPGTYKGRRDNLREF
ncbi:hypothetical protein [Duganella levis]|uniref:hypothetical protein n=1 Tax=Duganella levis TaxID=2692169 RepID=UPI002804637D|nr:hypothetical protein [Duganella levis]